MPRFELLKFQCAFESPRGKHVEVQRMVSDPGYDLQFHISSKFPGIADAAGPGPTLSKP